MERCNFDGAGHISHNILCTNFLYLVEGNEHTSENYSMSEVFQLESDTVVAFIQIMKIVDSWTFRKRLQTICNSISIQ